MQITGKEDARRSSSLIEHDISKSFSAETSFARSGYLELYGTQVLICSNTVIDWPNMGRGTVKFPAG